MLLFSGNKCFLFHVYYVNKHINSYFGETKLKEQTNLIKNYDRVTLKLTTRIVNTFLV